MLNIPLDTWATTMWRACWQGGLVVLVLIGILPWRLVATEPQSAVRTTLRNSDTAGRSASAPPQTEKRQPPSLVQTEVKDRIGGVIVKATELERSGKTSKIKVVFTKRIGNVGACMSLTKAFYDIAKARKCEYFTILKGWRDEDGSQILIGGFTNTKDADIKKEFGQQFDYNGEVHQKGDWESVSKYAPLFDNWPGTDESAPQPPSDAKK